MILYNGYREKADYLYREEVDSIKAEVGDKLVVHTAYSREQKEKVYVQHKVLETKEMLWKLIDGEAAFIYVCGYTIYVLS